MSVVQFLFMIGLQSLAHAVNNPTGDCQAADSGGRPTYHTPSPSDTYLPDCDAPLNRELWRVFATSDGTAYVIPRPDGLGLRYGLCSDDGSTTSVAALVQTYGMCTETVQDPSVINSMEPANALRITHVLHEHLVFRAQGQSFEPFVPDEDVLAACDLLNNRSQLDAARTYCDALQGRCDSNGMCIEIAIIPSEAAVVAIVPALNELYGIATPTSLHDDYDRATGGPASGTLWHSIFIAIGIVLTWQRTSV